MSALFACTRCAKRYPFEELSDTEQLCKECRNNFPTVKCTYCRSEFQQNDKNGVRAICKKCAHNVKAYGKPRACEYCSIIAAFIGNRCQRCSNSERRWGPPRPCDQCKQQCAFDRGEDTAKRMKGKMLCWLCTMAYKRALAKSMKAKEFTKSVSAQHKSSKSFKDETSCSSSAALAIGDDSAYSPGACLTGDDSQESTPYSPSKDLGFVLGGEDKDSLQGTPSGKSDHMTPSGSGVTTKSSRESGSRVSVLATSSSTNSVAGKHKASDPTEKLFDAKKVKLDKPSNGFSAMVKSQSVSEFGTSSDSVIMMTQMRGQLETIKRQLQERDRLIIEKEKKITELKAENVALDQKMRKRIESMQTESQRMVDELRAKNRELHQQISKLSKSGKKS